MTHFSIAYLQARALSHLPKENSNPRTVSHFGLCDRYATRIIGNVPERYTGVEIHGVRDYANGCSLDDETYCEPDNMHPEFFSVYLHLEEEGLECVGDFGAYTDALEYSQELMSKYGWPLIDHVQKQVENYTARVCTSTSTNTVAYSFLLSTGKTAFGLRSAAGEVRAVFLDNSKISSYELHELSQLMRKHGFELN